MIKRLLPYLILLFVYIVLPPICQQIFMNYNNYHFYIIVFFLSIVNILFAFRFLKLSSLLNFITALFITLTGILLAFKLVLFQYSYYKIQIAIFYNAFFSIVIWEIVFQLRRKNVR